MAGKTYQSSDWQDYTMDYANPHEILEPLEKEIAVVDDALAMLVAEGILPHADYDHDLFLAHRQAVIDHVEIPWTAITPRMQRQLYAISAIHQPQYMLAAGVFCGNTFLSNAGAAVGPGAAYHAKACIGVEIDPERAALAESNVRKLDETGVAVAIAADAIDTAKNWTSPIDLMYLDADGTPETGKGVYLTILQAGWDKMPAGAIVLAHNSVNAADRLTNYLEFVRDDANCTSVNVIFDGEGLEVSAKR
jgi:predicted O-methyltransferase YrrM